MNHDPMHVIILALLLKSSAYLGLMLAVLWLLRKRSAATQSLLLRAALVGLLALGAAGVAAPVWRLNLSAEDSPVASTLAEAQPVALSSETQLSASAVSITMPAPVQPEPPLVEVSGKAQGWLVALWAVGAAACFLRFLFGWLRTRRLVTASKPIGRDMQALLSEIATGGQRVAVRSHADLRSPVSFGIFKPKILLPDEHETWPQPEARMVLQHELAHVRRQDSAFLWLAEICRALFWLNPLVWIAVRQMRLLDERAADDAVLGNGWDAQSYAALLLAMARKAVGAPVTSAPVASSAMAQPSTVRLRVERLLDPSQKRQRPGLAGLLVMAVLGGALAIAIGGVMTAAAQDDQSIENGDDGDTPHMETRRGDDGSQEIIEKLRHITLPAVQFDDATLGEVVDYFRTKSRELDTTTSDPEKKGINFIVSADSAKKITLSLQNVPLVVAMKAATDLAGIRYRVEPFAVVFVPYQEKDAPLLTRVYQVPPTFLNDSGLGKDGTAREYLELSGVTFPDGASAHFNPSTSQLTVRTTTNNLDIIQTQIEQSAGKMPTTLAVSVEIYALPKKDALKLVSENRDKFDVSELVAALHEKVDGDAVKLIVSPHIITRSGLTASLESGENIEYVSGYIEEDGRDVPVNRTAFVGTRVEIVPIMGSDEVTIDARILVVEGLGEPRVETRKAVAPVSGKEVDVSSVRIDELTLNTVTTILAGQTKLVGVMNPPAHVNKDEAHVVFLKIDRVAAWEPEPPKPVGE
ncbi:MAG: hypothetical protein KDN22_18855 [Verrucomicrobiae bacterium]|nr:hypothetical protein [Verrucomicrobiae bacterium]